MRTTRIDKLLSGAGLASRRSIENFLTKNKVTVNGERVLEHGMRVNEKDVILVNGKSLKKPRYKYFIVNKPKGVISTASDEFGRKNVVSLIEAQERVYPVGRLDKDSIGLILLTNDGELANNLTHPRYHVPKTYEIMVAGIIPDSKLDGFRNGIELEEGKTLPAEVKILQTTQGKTKIRITLHEGKKRQIRRMCEVIGLKLLELKRVAIGQVRLGNLAPGEYRELMVQEINALQSSAKQNDKRE